jgi:serine/threonine protein kinase
MAPTFYDNDTNTRYIFDEDEELPIVFNANLKDIRKKLRKMDERLVLNPKMRVIGKGEYGIVIKSTIDDVVLKIMDIRDREDRHNFRHEIAMLLTLNQHTLKTTSPLGPKFYKGTIVNKEIGIIALQDLNSVFPKALKVETFTNDYIKELKNALKRLHKHGMAHGDLHTNNIYVATMPKGKYKVFFIDFGLSYMIEDIDKDKKGDMVKCGDKYIDTYKHPNVDVSIPLDNSWIYT